MTASITAQIVYSASLAFPMVRVEMFMLHWEELVISLELNTTERQLYLMSQVLYLSGEFCFQNNFEMLYKIAKDWKKCNLNRLADIGDLYGIIRILTPTEHDLTSLEYVDRLRQQLVASCANP